MALAATSYRWLSWLFLVGLGVQFFLAGLGLLGGGSIAPHQGLGTVLQLLAFVLVLLGLVGKVDRRLLGMSVVVMVLAGLQTLWAGEDLSPMWLRSFHVLGAFFIVGLAQQISRSVGLPFKRQDSVKLARR